MLCSATLMVTLQLGLFPLLANHMKLGFYAGLAPIFVWIFAGVPRMVSWEQNYVGVVITLLAFLIYSALRERLSWPRTIVCAALWGALLLLCPVALPVLLVWVLLLCLAPRQSSAQKLVLVLLPALMVAPWLLRNYQTFHQFVFIRNGLGLEMEVGNNSCASFSMEVNRLTSCYAQHHPNENREEASLVAEMGEVAYNKRKLRTAMEWIQENPGKFATLTVKRFVAFWTPSLLIKEQSPIKNQQLYWPPRDAIVSLASLASIAGLILLWKRNRNACIVFLLWLVLFPPVYYLCAYQERYRIPVVWAILIPACYAIRELGMKFTRQEGT